jgi:hypothetical protein
MQDISGAMFVSIIIKNDRESTKMLYVNERDVSHVAVLSYAKTMNASDSAAEHTVKAGRYVTSVT